MIHFPRLSGHRRLAASAAIATILAAPAFAQSGPVPKGDEPAARHGHAGQMTCGKGHGMGHSIGLSRLSVTGQGEARIAPDMATVQLGVTTRAAGAAEAMKQNSDQQRAVIAALTGAGIAERDIQTTGLGLNPVIDYSQDRAPSVTGYEASNNVSVRVAEIARLGEVLDAIVTAGANQINGINFTREDGADAEDEARRAAVEDARHKAEVLAEAAGLTLGPVLVLRDAQVSEGPRPMMRAAMAAEKADMPVQAGEVAMTAQVEMDFALIGRGCDMAPEAPDAPDGEAPAN